MPRRRRWNGVLTIQGTGGGGATKRRGEAVSYDELYSVSGLDDFELIEERKRVMTALVSLTDKYKQLNDEMTRRRTLRWMVAGYPVRQGGKGQ
jgi:hypothetical protein